MPKSHQPLMPARSRQRLFLVVIGILATCMLLGMLWTLRAERAPNRGTDMLRPTVQHGPAIGLAVGSES